METTKRSIAKAVSWRIVATFITTALGLGITGKWEFAAAIGLADTAFKFFVYLGHERLWNRIDFGRKEKHPEYHI